MTKIEIIPLCTGDSCTSLQVKNSLEIALSFTVFEILTVFHFPRKSKMAAESDENGNYSPLHRRLLYHPAGKKFTRNRSISYSFRDIDTFSFSAKIQDGRRKWRKLKFPSFAQETLVPPCGSKLRSKSLYLCYGFRDIDTFSFSVKIQDGRRKWRKLKLFPFAQETLAPPCGSKIRSKSLYLCYGFRDIDTFSFSAKIQDGRRKWRKLKLFPFAQETLVPPSGSKIRSKSLYLLQFSRY